MIKNEKQDHMALIAIVGIVAIVGLFLMFNSSSSASIASTENKDLSGQAYTSIEGPRILNELPGNYVEMCMAAGMPQNDCEYYECITEGGNWMGCYLNSI